MVESLHKSFLVYAGNPKIGHMTVRKIVKCSGGKIGVYDRKLFREYLNWTLKSIFVAYCVGPFR
jgi:hypothetical protein